MPAKGERQVSAQAQGVRRSGWVTFAAVVMFAVGFARVVSAINFFAGGNQISDLTNSLYGDQLWVWGLWDLAIAALALFAGLSLLSNGRFGRVVAYVWAIAVMFQSLLILTAAPWYAVTAIALSTIVAAGLATSSETEAW
jgi:hypothetical protein